MKKVALGLMSGTSADGVSLAIAEFQNHSFRLKAYKTFPYPESLQTKIRLGPELTVKELSKLNFELGHFYASCILKNRAGCSFHPFEIKVVGSHGQTIYHGSGDHPKNTLQIGEASVLARLTGIPVVSDFRSADIAAGGGGAPLVPFFDQFFYGQGPVRAMQNIGGIANVTVVGKNINPTAFDNGPGNCLMDSACRRISKGKMGFDRSGRLAAQGKIHRNWLRQLRSCPYFKQSPPKSTGLELFGESFLPKAFYRLKAQDQIATLTYFTAYTIHESYLRFIRNPISEIIVSGGGALNQTLLSYLQEFFAPTPVKSIEALGLPAQAKEPMAFAFFALRALEGKINHLPSVTGAKKACVLGKISR